MASAKTKIGRLLDKEDMAVDDVCSLVKALVELKKVEIQANDTGYGGALRDPEPPASEN